VELNGSVWELKAEIGLFDGKAIEKLKPAPCVGFRWLRLFRATTRGDSIYQRSCHYLTGVNAWKIRS
jgi:hypothetical protein